MDMLFFDSTQTLIRMVVSAVVVYICIVLFHKVSGKRSTSQLNNFDWVVTVMIGSIGASTIILKNVPIIEGRKVKVGSVPHPMKEEHYIEWIEIISGDRIYRTFLNPGDLPEAAFEDFTPEKVREFCNIHGLWRG